MTLRIFSFVQIRFAIEKRNKKRISSLKNDCIFKKDKASAFWSTIFMYSRGKLVLRWCTAFVERVPSLLHLSCIFSHLKLDMLQRKLQAPSVEPYTPCKCILLSLKAVYDLQWIGHLKDFRLNLAYQFTFIFSYLLLFSKIL